jgi:hypothetical protein
LVYSVLVLSISIYSSKSDTVSELQLLSPIFITISQRLFLTSHQLPPKVQTFITRMDGQLDPKRLELVKPSPSIFYYIYLSVKSIVRRNCCLGFLGSSLTFIPEGRTAMVLMLTLLVLPTGTSPGSQYYSEWLWICHFYMKLVACSTLGFVFTFC